MNPHVAVPDLPLLTDLEHLLYERQIQLPEFGTAAQQKMKHATVMISRVGGLGGTVAMLLARAGIGRLVLAHDGVVEHENLNRMPLAFREHLGQPRMQVFADTLHQINPDVELITDDASVSRVNAARLIEPADLIVDAAPLFEERYAMNQEAVRQRKPLVMAAMFGLEGYVSTFHPGKTPCLACVYPEAPDYWNLRVFPVLAASSTLIAAIATMEAVKAITGYGDTLANTLLYCDLENYRFQRLHIQKNPACAVCSHL